jgi:hypothetical protein
LSFIFRNSPAKISPTAYFEAPNITELPEFAVGGAVGVEGRVGSFGGKPVYGGAVLPQVQRVAPVYEYESDPDIGVPTPAPRLTP